MCLLPVCIGLLLLVLPSLGDNSSRLPVTNSSDIQYQVMICHLETAPMCGGVVVGEGIILTSATCVLQFGSIRTFLDEAVLFGGGTRLLFDIGNLSDVMIHPQYIDNPEIYDMALIKFIPEKKGPHLKSTVIRRTWKNRISSFCLMTSWWIAADSWPDSLVWQAVSPTQCSAQDPSLICFNSKEVEFNKKDYGSPIVCDNELVGLVPHGGGDRAINVTANYEWLSNTTAVMSNLQLNKTSDGTVKIEDTKPYLLSILQKLDILTAHKSQNIVDKTEDHLTNWNNQIVIPLNYVLLAIVIFFIVVLTLLFLFVVVLVYYVKK